MSQSQGRCSVYDKDVHPFQALLTPILQRVPEEKKWGWPQATSQTWMWHWALCPRSLTQEDWGPRTSQLAAKYTTSFWYSLFISFFLPGCLGLRCVFFRVLGVHLLVRILQRTTVLWFWHLSPSSGHLGLGCPEVNQVVVCAIAGWHGWTGANTQYSLGPRIRNRAHFPLMI